MRAHTSLLLLPLLVVACASARDDDARDAPGDAAGSTLAASATRDGLSERASPRRPPRPGAAVPARAAAMNGQPARVLRDAFGDPDLIRSDGPAEVWLYSSRTCHLDVMVYRDPAGGEPHVAFAAARATGLVRMGESACLREIAGGTAAAPPAGPRLSQAPGGES